MSPRKLLPGATALGIALALLAPTPGLADFRSQNGNTFIATDKPRKAKQHDELSSTIVIPPDFGATMPFTYTCVLQTFLFAGGEDKPVRKVRAAYQAHAYLLDHRDGSVQVLDVDHGTFRTGPFGDFFQIEIPESVVAAIFTEGFESGDVAALLQTRMRFTRGKRLDSGSLQCLIQEDER